MSIAQGILIILVSMGIMILVYAWVINSQSADLGALLETAGNENTRGLLGTRGDLVKDTWVVIETGSGNTWIYYSSNKPVLGPNLEVREARSMR